LFLEIAVFIDEIKIFAHAGHGGAGAIAFLREAYRPKGGPSGGNGARGGDVILEASHDLNNLIAQFYVPRLIAKNGDNGHGKGMDGKGALDVIVKVPCGTLVWRLPDNASAAPQIPDESEDSENPPKPFMGTGAKSAVYRTSPDQGQALEINLEAEPEVEKTKHPISKEGAELVVDMTTNGQRFVLCKGGRGGLGNRNFATARHQTPRFAQPGEPGEEGSYLFELRLMAEIGLVGYPNAGKSTLLTAVSAARPKIASYPFTTLHPQVGIMEYEDFKRLTVCDVPGLIEGAHLNLGLGHSFLRHIQRCKVLVILVDMAGTDAREPWDDYRNLLKELELFDPALLERPRLVIANKMDEPAAVTNLKKFKRKITKTPLLQMSAAFDQGVEEFKQAVRKSVEAASKADI
jgi:GTP-binding protein